MMFYLLVGTLVLSALATLVLGIFMLMDSREGEEYTDLTSRITRAVDVTARANGLFSRFDRLRAVIFLILVLLLALLAVWFLKSSEYRGGWGSFYKGALPNGDVFVAHPPRAWAPLAGTASVFGQQGTGLWPETGYNPSPRGKK